jgi:hypothetical protein
MNAATVNCFDWISSTETTGGIKTGGNQGLLYVTIARISVILRVKITRLFAGSKSPTLR